jgi:hypothetical protein
VPDTFGKRQREADKVKRREAKDARRAARKAGLPDPTDRSSDLPEVEPEADASAGPTDTPEERADDHS